MEQPLIANIRLEAERHTACGGVQIVRRSWTDTIDLIGEPDEHRLELALLPLSRQARGGFPDRWGPDRFEPIGAMFLLPAGHRVRTLSDCRRQSSIICTFRPDAVRHWFDHDLEWTNARLRGGLNIASPAIRDLLLRLGAELRTPGFASATLIELMSAQIAVELARHCLDIAESGASGGLAPWRLRLIDDRLAEPGDAPSLADLAELCGVSVRQLTRGFRTSRGCSIGSHIGDDRIARARAMLAGTAPIKAIAYDTGFASPSAFSIAFRRATGETPRACRQRTIRSRILS